MARLNWPGWQLDIDSLLAPILVLNYLDVDEVDVHLAMLPQ